MLPINDAIVDQLDLSVLESTEVVLADGSLRKCDLVGPIDIRFKNRSTTCRALVLPWVDEVLLGGSAKLGLPRYQSGSVVLLFPKYRLQWRDCRGWHFACTLLPFGSYRYGYVVNPGIRPGSP